MVARGQAAHFSLAASWAANPFCSASISESRPEPDPLADETAFCFVLACGGFVKRLVVMGSRAATRVDSKGRVR